MDDFGVGSMKLYPRSTHKLRRNWLLTSSMVLPNQHHLDWLLRANCCNLWHDLDESLWYIWAVILVFWPFGPVSLSTTFSWPAVPECICLCSSHLKDAYFITCLKVANACKNLEVCSAGCLCRTDTVVKSTAGTNRWSKLTNFEVRNVRVS